MRFGLSWGFGQGCGVGSAAPGSRCPPVSSTCVSSSVLSRAFCRICAVQITTSLFCTRPAKKVLWLLSPLMDVTLKVSCSSWNSFSVCWSTRCTCAHRTALSTGQDLTRSSRGAGAGQHLVDEHGHLAVPPVLQVLPAHVHGHACFPGSRGQPDDAVLAAQGRSRRFPLVPPELHPRRSERRSRDRPGNETGGGVWTGWGGERARQGGDTPAALGKSEPSRAEPS